MKFDCGNAKRCLVDEGEVFTVRKWKSNGLKQQVFGKDVYVRNVGQCIKWCLFEIRKKEDLRDYLEDSGFRTLDEWWDKIIDFCGNGEKWLYRVKLIDREQQGLEKWIGESEAGAMNPA